MATKLLDKVLPKSGLDAFDPSAPMDKDDCAKWDKLMLDRIAVLRAEMSAAHDSIIVAQSEVDKWQNRRTLLTPTK